MHFPRGRFEHDAVVFFEPVVVHLLAAGAEVFEGEAHARVDEELGLEREGIEVAGFDVDDDVALGVREATDDFAADMARIRGIYRPYQGKNRGTV